MKKLLLATFALCIYLTVSAQPRLGSRVPDFTLPDAAGSNISLSSLRGKVVLLDFWASWCGPCRTSNKQMRPVYEKYQPKGFEIFGVSVDDRKGAWINAVKQDKIKWLQVIDPQASAGSRIMQIWNVRFIPSTFLIDKDGVLVAINPEKEELESWLQKLLK